MIQTVPKEDKRNIQIVINMHNPLRTLHKGIQVWLQDLIQISSDLIFVWTDDPPATCPLSELQ